MIIVRPFFGGWGGGGVVSVNLGIVVPHFSFFSILRPLPQSQSHLYHAQNFSFTDNMAVTFYRRLCICHPIN